MAQSSKPTLPISAPHTPEDSFWSILPPNQMTLLPSPGPLSLSPLPTFTQAGPLSGKYFLPVCWWTLMPTALVPSSQSGLPSVPWTNPTQQWLVGSTAPVFPSKEGSSRYHMSHGLFPCYLQIWRFPLSANVQKKTPTHTPALPNSHHFISSLHLSGFGTHTWVFVSGLPRPLKQSWETAVQGPCLAHCLSSYWNTALTPLFYILS
jgi:hypothetical protein